MPALPVLEPSRVTVMIKPVGALCNLECVYCYYLPTKETFGQEKRMSLATLEEVFASILPRFEQHATIAWQGGEPTLAGLPFFEKAIEFQKKYARPGQTVSNALQTNATLLNDDWCRFLKKYQFLVGVSMDGPPHLHDHYRVTNSGDDSADAVLRGMRLLQKHGVDYNVLCVLNDRNVDKPDEVLHYLLNLGARFLQFIPAIEWDQEPPTLDAAERSRAAGAGPRLQPFSPTGEQYGRFMCRIFDLWFERYRRQVSIRLIDALLNKLVLGVMPFCIHDAACHNQLTIEHDGSVFGCDHYVFRRWQLGKIGDQQWHNRFALDGEERVELGLPADVAAQEQEPADLDEAWLDRIDTNRFGAFAARKRLLPETCLQCEYNALCHGGCPKHRPHRGEIPEPTTLCAGYKMLYSHALPRLKWMADYLRRDQMPPEPDAMQPGRSVASAGRRQKVGPNDRCPCGSGLKYKKCCGKPSAVRAR